MKALSWSFAYFFFLLSTYYMLLPIRDAFGIRGGPQDLPWLFLGTFLVSLVTAPLQAAIAARMPRRQFVPVIYLFLVFNMLLFWFLLKSEVAPGIVSKAFFIWITVFSVFTVSIFWTFMSDLYSTEQGKRLFGFIAAGGSLGSILGPMLTRSLVEPLGVANLLLVASVLLVLAVVCSNRLERAAAQLQAETRISSRLAPLARSSPSAAACSTASACCSNPPTWVASRCGCSCCRCWGPSCTFTQAHIVASLTDDMAQRTRIFALIAQWVGILSLVMQLVGTGRIIKAVGSGPALAILPLVFIGGFVTLMFFSSLFAVAAFQACSARRTSASPTWRASRCGRW